MSGEKALTKDIVEKCTAAESLYKETMSGLNDMYIQRLLYIASIIAKHSKKDWMKSSTPVFSIHLQNIKKDGFIYYHWYPERDSDPFNIGTDFDLTRMFPISWVFNDSFEEELIASREKYLKLNEKKIINSIKAKLTAEELTFLHKVK